MRTQRNQDVAGMKVQDAVGPRTRLLQSFHPGFRREVRQLARRSTYFADLAATFPGLLFALATGYGSVRSRQAALARVAAGAGLREAADALGLPWWLRRLPPQAFTERLAKLPADPDFSARVVNLLPSSPTLAGPWLERVLQAYRACHADFALWVAKHDRLHSPVAPDTTLPYLAAWAWYSSQPDTLGGRIVRRPWSPSLSPRRAIEEMAAWRKRIALALSLAAQNDDPWLDDGTAQGFDFVALRSIDDFIAESEIMDNCLDGFGEKIDTGTSYVFSIRNEGKPVGDVEIGPHGLDGRVPTIVQLRGPRNRRVSPHLWRATYAWFSNQSLRQPELKKIDAAVRRRAWRDFWKPYFDALDEKDRAGFQRLTIEIDRVRLMRSPPRRRASTRRTGRTE
jgi:hypothetical protein